MYCALYTCAVNVCVKCSNNNKIIIDIALLWLQILISV